MRLDWPVLVASGVLAAGCSMLFDPEATSDGGPIDAGSGPDASPRIECAGNSAEDCPAAASECHCGLCAIPEPNCPRTRLAYVRAHGETECVPGAIDVDASFRHSCAVRSDGSVWCWGWNGHDQLGGASDMAEGLLPVRVDRAPNRPPAVEVALGIFHSCARLENGTVECWGGNEGPGGTPGLLGAGALEAATSRTPLAVLEAAGDPLQDITHLVAEGQHTCARDQGADLHCWGTNSHGEVGTGDTTPVDRATRILSDVTGHLGLGSQHTCARRTEDIVTCWGRQNLGQIGDNGLEECSPDNEYDELIPRTVLTEGDDGPLEPAVNVGAGRHFACAVTDGPREIHCWGENDDFALGDTSDPARCEGGAPEQCHGTTACAARQAQIAPQAYVEVIDGGAAFACALMSQRVYCWGSNVSLQQGPEADPAAIYTVPGPELPIEGGATDLAAGWNHACVTTGEGKVYCWGANEGGQLGDGTTSHRAEPVEARLCP